MAKTDSESKKSLQTKIEDLERQLKSHEAPTTHDTSAFENLLNQNQSIQAEIHKLGMKLSEIHESKEPIPFPASALESQIEPGAGSIIVNERELADVASFLTQCMQDDERGELIKIVERRLNAEIPLKTMVKRKLFGAIMMDALKVIRDILIEVEEVHSDY